MNVRNAIGRLFPILGITASVACSSTGPIGNSGELAGGQSGPQGTGGSPVNGGPAAATAGNSNVKPDGAGLAGSPNIDGGAGGALGNDGTVNGTGGAAGTGGTTNDGTGGAGGSDGGPTTTAQVDDWAFSPSTSLGAGAFPGASGGMTASSPSGTGLSTGGAKDVNNFRENIANGFLPRETDITDEGIFYGYFFDRGQNEPCSTLFCPTYSQMLSTDILSNEQESYLSVGLTSGLAEADMHRKKLNLVVVLDISGSMGSPFNSYYYDQFGNRVEVASSTTKTKMALANESIVSMLGHLKAGDRFGMVLFDDISYLAKPLSSVETTDMKAIEKHILEIESQGSTNMEAGYKLGAELLAAQKGADPAEYENRIIFLTDAMPNTGDISESSLLGMVNKSATDKLYTTFVGIGVDFNTTLIESITKVRGANYYSVHDEAKFKQRMDDEFEYMVTPLVFDLELKLQSTGFEIAEVHGSPEADQATGVLMRANTLFPSKSVDGETKGGVILLKLKRTGEANDLSLSASYKDRTGQPFSSQKAFTFNAALDVAPNTGIRKAILLSRQVTLMKQWIHSERASLTGTADSGLSQWEQTSVPLKVSAEYKNLFQRFLTGFQAESAALTDPTLDQEAKLLQKLSTWVPGG